MMGWKEELEKIWCYQQEVPETLPSIESLDVTPDNEGYIQFDDGTRFNPNTFDVKPLDTEFKREAAGQNINPEFVKSVGGVSDDLLGKECTCVNFFNSGDVVTCNCDVMPQKLTESTCKGINWRESTQTTQVDD
jgi:hypothetical protein